MYVESKVFRATKITMVTGMANRLQSLRFKLAVKRFHQSFFLTMCSLSDANCGFLCYTPSKVIIILLLAPFSTSFFVVLGGAIWHFLLKVIVDTVLLIPSQLSTTLFLYPALGWLSSCNSFIFVAILVWVICWYTCTTCALNKWHLYLFQCIKSFIMIHYMYWFIIRLFSCPLDDGAFISPVW